MHDPQMQPGASHEHGDHVTVRPLEDLGEYRQCVNLQELTWGEGFVEKVPPLLMKVVHRNGGIVGGAVDGDGRLLGFVFGIAGVDEGHLRHWSHMLAVRPGARGRGLGRRLKLFQREELLDRGFDLALWSYDPLVARNGHLNFNRLGVEAEEYVVNMYGAETGSRLHAGLGTDRFVVRWKLDSERTRRTISGDRPGPPAHASDAPAVVEYRDGAGSAPISHTFSDSAVVRIEVPRDIQKLKEETPDAAEEWREATRRAFRHYLNGGYGVDGLQRAPDGRCFYVLSG